MTNRQQQYCAMEYEEAQTLGHQAVPFRDGWIYYGPPENKKIDACKKLHSKDGNSGTEYLRKQKVSRKGIHVEADERVRMTIDKLEIKRINEWGRL